MLRLVFTYNIAIVLTLILSAVNAQYSVPPVEIEVFSPKGFEASIPAEEGVSLFAFHANLNDKKGNAVEPDAWSSEVVTPKNGRYTFRDAETALEVGDILYYWTYVIHDGLVYRGNDAEFVVTTFANKSSHSRIRRAGPTDCIQSISIVNGVPQECASRLMFEEQFHGRTLDLSKWSRERRVAGKPDFEFVTYLDDDSDIMGVKAGNLYIKPKRYVDVYGRENLKVINLGVNCTGEIGTADCHRTERDYDIAPPILSGQITTKGKFSFMYGNIMIRAKVPSVRWLFPQFFVDPTNETYGNRDYSSGQMRVGLTLGGSTCNVYGGAMLSAKEQFRNTKMCSKQCKNNKLWSSDFHYYGLKWTRYVITITVDDEKYCEIRPGNGFGHIQVNGENLPSADLLKASSDKLAPFDQPFHLTIGLGVGGHGDFPDNMPMKPWQNLGPRAMTDFWKSIEKSDYPNGDELLVDFIHIFSV